MKIKKIATAGLVIGLGLTAVILLRSVIAQTESPNAIHPLSMTFKIIDANRRVVGYPINTSEVSSDLNITIYDPNFRTLETFMIPADKIDGIRLSSPETELRYATADCTGQAYAFFLRNPLPLLALHPVGQTEYYLPDRRQGVAPPNTYLFSSFRRDDGNCVIYPNPRMNDTYDFPVNQITLPYVPPFDIAPFPQIEATTE